MQLKITCPECACHYAVVGAAFFCPACGHNSADLMFTQSLQGIGSVMDALGNVRIAIADKDVAETTVRQSVEAGLQNAVTSYQRYAESLYSRLRQRDGATHFRIWVTEARSGTACPANIMWTISHPQRCPL